MENKELTNQNKTPWIAMLLVLFIAFAAYYLINMSQRNKTKDTVNSTLWRLCMENCSDKKTQQTCFDNCNKENLENVSR